MIAALAEVRRASNDEVIVTGLSPGSALLRELAVWLRAREDVVSVRERPSGRMEVRCRTRGLSLVHSVDDFLFSRRRPQRAFTVSVMHRLPGRLRLRIAGVSDDDLPRLTTWIARQPGVLRATCSSATATLLVVHDTAALPERELLERVRATVRADWPASPPSTEQHTAPATAAATAALALSLSGVAPGAIAAALTAIAAYPALRRSVEALRQRRASVDLLDVSAVSLSIATGQITTAALIAWLLAIGDLLLHRSGDRARRAVSTLTELDVPVAFRVDREGHVTQVAPGRLRKGDRIVISAGRRVPADGTLVSGRVYVDEKALTGESKAKKRFPGDRVLAATAVVDGEAIAEVLRAGMETTAARVLRAIEGAGAKPMTLQKDAERVTDRLVLPTFGVAGAAVALSGQVDRLISVLITDFGSGIRVALPVSALSSIAAAARSGILVKGAQYLERLAHADVVVFDKTGTLTEGEPVVTEARLTGGFDERRFFALAAGAEASSMHPAAAAIRRAATARGIVASPADARTARHAAGLGVRARVEGCDVVVGSARWLRQSGVPVDEPAIIFAAPNGSRVVVAIDGEFAGVLTYADRPRSESRRVVRRLRESGRKVMLLSGDAGAFVSRIAASIGIDDAVGELLPDDKLQFVRDLQGRGHVVAMVGDGINDAPALAQADVGISLHGGTEVALETADVVLLDGGISRLPRAFRLGESAVRSVRRGLGLVIAPNAAAIVLGAIGLLAPGLAALINNGSTIVAAASGLLPLLEVR